MKAVLEFDLTDPDDQSKHRHACLGSAYRYQVIDEILQYIRNKKKYKVHDMTYKDLEDKARREWYDSADEAVKLSNDDVVRYVVSMELEEVREKICEYLDDVNNPDF